MSLSGLFVRFALVYIALLVVIAVSLGVLGIKSNSGVNTAALLGAVMWACLSFAKSNKRYFTKEEKTRVVIGMLIIDIFLQTVLALAAAAIQSIQLSPGAMAFALAFVGLLHAAVIYFFVGLTGKQYAKQIEKSTG